MIASELPGRTSVVICSYSVDRWADLAAAVASVEAQVARPRELVLVVDHNEELLAATRAAWPHLVVVASDGPPGLSGARNSGAAVGTGDLVAYLDDDARAAPSWLAALVAPFADARVMATGGWAEASWDGTRPRWWPREFDWVVGCSYAGQPTARAVARNPLGCSMAFRRSAILDTGGFTSGIGRIGRLPIGGEETELCIRVRLAQPTALVVLEPASRVRHRVRRERATWSYFRTRCYQEGRSKARIATLVGARSALASERAYTFRALPLGVLRGLRDAAAGDVFGLTRSAAILAGLAITTAGYLAGRLGLDPIRASEPKTSRWAAP